ncbi:hypothetical protein JW758_01980 [Candidatus Peregrinibacteria bacterium]|nr:hypothetical protein [Candidatus Peregrinibacteria bacterium]
MPPNRCDLSQENDSLMHHPQKSKVELFHLLKDIDLIDIICPIKDSITKKDVELYSESLFGRTKPIFDDLAYDDKLNVITFSKLSDEAIRTLELNPHYLAGVHSRDICFLLRVMHACEECRKTKEDTHSSVKNVINDKGAER